MTRFFPQEIEYHGFNDFFDRRNNIRNIVDKLTSDELYVYRLYVLSTPFITDYVRNKIWDFLMHDSPDWEIIDVKSRLFSNNKRDYL